MAKVQFLSLDQKLIHFAKKSKIELNVYWYGKTLKVFEGAEIMLYHYDLQGDLIINAVLMCTGITMNHFGLSVTLVNRENFMIYNIGDHMKNIHPLDIVFHTPYNSYVERTVRVSQRGAIMTGITAAVDVRSKSDPKSRIPLHSQAISLIKVDSFFTEEELDFAYARLEVN